MWKRSWSQDFQDEPWKILTGKQITMKLSSASSEFCGSTRSMSKVMSVSKFIEKSFTQYQILSFCKLADYLISQICIVGRNIISSVPIMLNVLKYNENLLNMKFRICCDYRTTILSNSFFNATTLRFIYHEKFFKWHGFGFEQKLSRIDGWGLKIPRIGGFAYPYSPPSSRFHRG